MIASEVRGRVLDRVRRRASWSNERVLAHRSEAGGQTHCHYRFG